MFSKLEKSLCVIDGDIHMTRLISCVHPSQYTSNVPSNEWDFLDLLCSLTFFKGFSISLEDPEMTL